MRALGTLAGLAALAIGCSKAQPVEPDVRQKCLTWQVEIAALVAGKCTSCHGATNPAAGYRTDSYLGTISKATAGDATSPLVTKVDPKTADATHAAVTDAHPQLATWTVDCDLAYAPSEIHEAGIMNPSDPNFHGTLVATMGWDLGVCAQCHGSDFAGGKSGVACTTCHAGGPTACTTCHGQPPATGAHVAHATGAELGRKLDCTECHIKPTVYSDAGHLHPPPGKVTFGALATTGGAAASYDTTDKSCRGVYCHGGGFTDTAATLTQPHWVADPTQAACGTCHGLPPSGHAATSTGCANCHSLVVAADRSFVDTSKHVNGAVDFAGGTGCTACHGQPPATGAHLAHSEAQHRLSNPVACSECHTVPATVTSPGHADGIAEVFPPGTSGIATTGGAMPTFNAADATCANVYCHGGARPKWTAGAEAAACGTCHGIPPADDAHAPTLRLTDCATCHPATVDANGAIKTDGVSSHMNGKIDVAL
jgi:predicted CxxxxCH...CXXCH cytochrome family protein